MGPRRIVKVEEDEEEIVVQFNGLMSGNEDMRSRMSSCKFLVSASPFDEVPLSCLNHN